MKTLYLFTDSFPYGSGETFLESEIGYLENNFDNIYIIPIFAIDIKQKRPLKSNVKVFIPPFRSLKNKKELILKGIFNNSPIKIFIKEFFKKKVYLSYRKFWIWCTHLLVTRYLIKYLKRNNLLNIFYDNNNICYFYWGLRWSYILPFVDEIKAKVLVRFHGSDLYEELNEDYIPFREQQIKKINCAVFVSMFGLNYFNSKYPFFKETKYLSRLGTIDYGLNPYKRDINTTIVSCSNLVPVKRVELIVKSLYNLSLNINWIHFGDGPEMPKIKELLNILPSNIKVELRGRISNKELMYFYSNNSVDLFINTSYSEGIPVSIIEALSFGIPVIATNVGGTGEIVDDTVGKLIDKDSSPEFIARTIEQIIDSENYYELRINARKRWEEMCDADKNYNEFVSFLLKL